MKIRIISIICIVLLIFTITSPISGTVFSYADTDTQSLSDTQKVDLCMATYYNYRKGWFTSSNVSSVPALLTRYANQFFESSSNNTGINSLSDLASQVSVNKDNGHWKVTITSQGITFLDHLVKWMLGKNEFPNLYSGGSWGVNTITNDNAYNGALFGNDLIFIYDSTYRIPSPSGYSSYIKIPGEHVNIGSPANGYSAIVAKDAYLRTYPNTDFGNVLPSSTGSALSQSVQFANNVSYNQNINVFNNVGSSSYKELYEYDQNGCVLKFTTSYCILWSDYGATLRGEACYYRDTQEAANILHAGFVTYIAESNRYVFRNVNEYTNPTNYSNANINFQTDNFNKNDIGSDGVSDPITLTPVSGTQSSINNVYDNDTVNNFYNEYITNYTEYNSSVINEGDIINPDPDPDPDTAPGGTTPPWTDNGSAGTLTPDGNGGFNLSLPDLTIPDLNIDWSLNGLKEKFPFSIPWDLLAFFTVLNAEPETPAIEAQIDLGIVNWDIDWDLHNFDTLAVLLRNLEFIGFCLALILITRSIIKG